MNVVVIIAIVAFVFVADKLFSGGGGGIALDAGSADSPIAPVSSDSSSANSADPFQTIFTGGSAMTKLQQFAQAIYDFEDPNKNQVATRNNNPGNLKYAGQAGATGADSRGFAIFPTLDAGMTALQKQLELDSSRGLTVQQLFNKWLGGSVNAPVNNAEGNSASYAATVAAKLGVSVTTTLAEIFG